LAEADVGGTATPCEAEPVAATEAAALAEEADTGAMGGGADDPNAPGAVPVAVAVAVASALGSVGAL